MQSIAPKETQYVLKKRISPLPRILFICSVALISQSVSAQNWVDMGIRAENGDIIYWSSSDFAEYKNGTFGFVEYGEQGSTFGWGDISGEKTGADLSQYGGQNPPRKIEGNPRYDIVTAKLGFPYRLPTHSEIQSLIDNCNITKTTINRGTPRGTNGLPSWVQGQWMINDAVLVRGRTGDGVINTSVSIRIDGGIASYYSTSGNDYWEGPYHYSDGKIIIGKLTLIVDDDRRVLKDKSNNVFSKISSRTVNNKVTGILFTSKINGNQLLFAMPPSVSTYNSGKYSIVTTNSQEIDYWTGTLFDKDNDCAVCMKMTSSDGFGVIAQPRSYHKRVRAIKVDVGSGVRLAEEKRISDSIANENRRIADSIAREKERRQQELLEEKRKQEKEIIESLYGEWEGRYVFSKIKLVIDSMNASLYRSGNLIERCPIKISLKGKNLNVEFLNRRRNYYSNELVLYYSIKQNHGWVTTSSSLIYKLQYNAHLNCFQFNCQEGDEYDTTIQLTKPNEKKKKKK